MSGTPETESPSQGLPKATSRAYSFEHYGPSDVLELRQLPTPKPADGQVLVRVRAASVNPVDWHEMRGSPYVMRLGSGLRRPKDNRIGGDVAGVVDEVGPGVTGFSPGDAVYGLGHGTLADFALAREDGLAPKPELVSFEEAAAVPIAGFTAVQGLRDHGGLKPGQKVLINGAAGGVGTFAVQIARALGAEVAAVCSARNVDMVRSIGAHRVYDYLSEDFARSGEVYDLILDNVGNRPLTDMRRVLAPAGTMVVVGARKGDWIAPLYPLIRALAVSPFVKQKFTSFLAKKSQEDLLFFNELLETGELKPVIDRSYALEQVPEAIAYLEEGHARGKVVITV